MRRRRAARFDPIAQKTAGTQPFETGEKLAPEQSTEHVHWKKEIERRPAPSHCRHRPVLRP
jgi:hypothetical protein